MHPRRGYALSYVKVDIHSRSPRLWGWALHRAGSDNLLRRSEAAYGGAEDAWKAGPAAHADFGAAAPRSPVPAEEEEELAC